MNKPAERGVFPPTGMSARARWASWTELVGRQDQGGAVFLEDDQTYPVSPLIGIGEKGENCAFCGCHAFCNSHRPGGIDHKKDEVGGFLDAHFALKIALLNCEGDLFALFDSVFLIGGGGAQGGIKSKIVRFAFGWARLDIATAFALGVRARAATTVTPVDAVQRILDFTWEEKSDQSLLFRRLPTSLR